MDKVIRRPFMVVSRWQKAQMERWQDCNAGRHEYGDDGVCVVWMCLAVKDGVR